MPQREVPPRRPRRLARRRHRDDGGRTDTTTTDRDRPPATDVRDDASTSDRRLTADLFLRAHSPAPERDRSVVETLDALAASGGLADYAVHRIPPEVDLDGDTTGETDGPVHSLLAVADRLSDSEDGRGYPFRRVSRRSAITGETGTVVLLPARCLLVYEGPELIDVAPHFGPGNPWTVEDSLATMAEITRTAAEAEAPIRTARSDPGRDRGSGDRLDLLERVRDGSEWS